MLVKLITTNNQTNSFQNHHNSEFSITRVIRLSIFASGHHSENLEEILVSHFS
jgi:hypothetical protein